MIVAIRFILLMSLLTGVLYPLSMTAVAQLVFSDKANGSLIKVSDKIIGSELVAQKFTENKYFWSRPSAIDYNSSTSGGSNLAIASLVLQSQVEERRKSGAVEDMLFASASGLDPHISVPSAKAQVERVVQARQLSSEALNSLLNSLIEPRQFGFLGEERVNVLKLNLSLDEMK